MTTSSSSYLRPLLGKDEELTLDATDGSQLIKEASQLFSYIDRNFIHWDELGVPGPPTQPTPVRIHEVVKDGSLKDFFGNPSLDWGWEESQVVLFCAKHYSWLHNKWHATLFPLKSNVVARVDFDAHNRLGVYAYRLHNNRLWHVKVSPRIITPGSLH